MSFHDDEIVWRDVPGYESLYEVNAFGDIRRKTRRGNWREGGLMRGSKLPSGHEIVNLSDETGKTRTMIRAKVVAAAWLGPCPPGKEVYHLDRDKTNNAVSNLEYLTRREIIKKSFEGGRRDESMPRGGRHANAKLTEEKVRAIIMGIKEGKSLTSLAEEFHISVPTIIQIKYGRTWKHVSRDEDNNNGQD